ncbi:MAG: glycerate kinase [Oscillospiraceae bacterium]|nr:glycerate kinase [Oscillospiraceae bacterium]
MKAVIAIDSLKGSLTSMEAGAAIAEGIRKAYPDAETVVRPLADGGEGTVDALVAGMGGRFQEVTVRDPLGRPVKAKYGIIESTKTAIMEMSAAAGITLVSDSERNPLNTTTYGVGEMIKDAITSGCREFIIGIGGSATNDGGIGMLQALGYGFLDKDGNQVPFGAKGLKELCSITDANVTAELKECRFHIACDVTNPLCGAKGCSAVYGPQKGATASMILDMDGWLADYAALTQKVNPAADAEYPGTGAAGGIGFAFLSYTNAALVPGIDLILGETRLEDYIKDADVVITGEGRLDFQTAMGKAPSGVAKLAKKYDIPVIAFAGSVTKDAIECNHNGIDAFFPILRRICTLDEAMDAANAKANMTDTVEQVFRIMKAWR